jgi:solute carrier family 15 oligopeptide transporter 1
MKYGKTLVNDVKTTLKVLVLFVPLPIFGLCMTNKAADGPSKPRVWTVTSAFTRFLPDQMQVINPLLILIFIPLFTYLIYPAFAKCNFLKTPLQRMVCGGLLTAASFGISAGVSFALEATEPSLPTEGNCQIRIYNPLDCNAILTAEPYIKNQDIKTMGYTNLDIPNVYGEKSCGFQYNWL